MKKIAFLLCLMVGSVYAQQTTQNLITNSVGGSSGQWSGIGAYSQLNGQHPISVYGCCTSFGSAPFFDTSTGSPNGQSGQFIWSYGQATVQQIIAVNQALSGAGIQINGYNWGYEVRNMNGNDGQGSVDTLTATSFLKHTNGTVLLSATQTYSAKQEWNWHGGTVTASSPYALADVGQLGIQFTSRDVGFWAGYYGPQVRNVSLSLNYDVQQIDPCTNNPLHSPSCPGYQQAYHDQQCSINPLHATTCPGYQQAYYTQQCSANPLYDSGCPGYQQAYFNQQCSNDPLYNNQCPGYQQAYFNQQCSLSGLYDRSCPNYAQAYATQQLLNQQNSSTQTASVSVTPASEPVVEVKEDGKVSTDVPLVADPVVNSVLTKNTEAKKEDKKEEKKEEPKAEKPKENTARQAAIAAATKPDPATQTQSEKEFEQSVASQSAAVATISFVPGFSAYQNAILPDTNALLMRRQYDKPVVDNARAMRQLNGASDRLHDEMVQQQYR